jgi:cytochrome c peroxidase
MRNGVTLAFALTVLTGCNAATDRLFCGDPGCEFPAEEWRAIKALALTEQQPQYPVPDDPSNKYNGNALAETLGQKLFHDSRFSGVSLQTDALKRPVIQARAPKGQPAAVACVTCHDANRGGVDTSSLPGNVSIGAGWSDTNAPASFNTAYYALPFWNGRVDSLWAQAVAANEGPLMNGSRLQTAWVLGSMSYRDDYNALFTDPMPIPLLEANGQCKLDPDCAGTKGCRESKDATGATGCWPIYPPSGKPGNKPGCQMGDASEPAGDAFDCMPKGQQDDITRVLVNFGKALEAYERRLVTGQSPFDRWVQKVSRGEGTDSIEFSDLAQRGARLFVGRAACVDCHSTPMFSDSKYYNAGVPQVGPGVPTEMDCPAGGVCDCTVPGKNCPPWGALDGLTKLGKNGFRRDSVWSDNRQDLSKMSYVQTPPEQQVAKGSWRTPSLRNVALTAPYMHNGSLATLEAVVDHYNLGGSTDVPGAPAARIKPLFLSADDRAALVAFMQSLTSAPPPAALTAPPTLP